jgi:hypothetical protein
LLRTWFWFNSFGLGKETSAYSLGKPFVEGYSWMFSYVLPCTGEVVGEWNILNLVDYNVSP